MPFSCSSNNKKRLILIAVQSLLAFGIRFPNVSLGAFPKKKREEREREKRSGREREKERKKMSFMLFFVLITSL